MLAENRSFVTTPDKVLTEGFLDWGGTGGMSECFNLYGHQQKLLELVYSSPF